MLRLISAVFLACAACLASVAIAGCTLGTHDNFTNPPPGPPATCAEVAPLARCVGGAVSYACTADRPDHGDANLVCDDGTAGIGATLYCCAPYGRWATACGPKSGIAGCGARSIGFTCLGETAPDQAATFLVCSAPVASAASTSSTPGEGTDYCCTTVAPSTGACRCSSYDEAAATCGYAHGACGGASFGFTCAAGHDPRELNPALGCEAAGSTNGATDAPSANTFCCATP